MTEKHRPAVLVILDGWGYSEKKESNAIYRAHTPVWDHLCEQHPNSLICTSGAEVGLPGDQMGNSEVGHLNLGAGRVVHQELSRIDLDIASGDFYTNPVLVGAVDKAIKSDKAVHIMGLLSTGGVHSHELHIQSAVKMAVRRGATRVYLHAFLDGRDTPPKSAAKSIKLMEACFSGLGGGSFASVIGRYFALDRDNNWDRVKKAYDLIANGESEFTAPSAIAALEAAYERGETDEFVQSTVISQNGQAVHVEDGDVMIMMNFRADRARQISQVFFEKEFTGFERKNYSELAEFVCLTGYSKDFDVPVVFQAKQLENTFGEYISSLGLKQLRVAETEKYAHVTFFFNGGEERAFPGEDRELIPSPKVGTYDQQPEMNASVVTDRLVEAIKSGRYDAIICNYANADMVGHSGNFKAAVKAIEALDVCLGRLYKVVKESDADLLITADHGNAEKMLDETTGQPHTAHTNNLVPFVYVGSRPAGLVGEEGKRGSLKDITPTMLYLMGLDKAPEMNGSSLVKFI